MITTFLYGLIMLAGGLVIGATLLVDWLHRPRRREPARPRLPLTGSLVSTRRDRLELPRRQP